MSERKALVVGEATAIATLLEARGFRVTLAAVFMPALAAWTSDAPDVAIVVLPLPHDVGDAMIEQLAEARANVPIVVVGYDASIRTSDDAMRAGAQVHLHDPSDRAALLTVVGVATGVRMDSSDRPVRHGASAGTITTGPLIESLLGESAELRRVRAQARKIAERVSRGDTPAALLLGETGTGKGLVARCIHHASARKNQPFIEVSCASIPAPVLDLELFGQERGRFGDGHGPRAGMLEAAEHGTVYLGEVHALPQSLQAKLLAAIEDRSLRRVGGARSIPMNAQIIAGAEPEIGALVESKELRADLLHGLAVMRLDLPPLRARGDDRLLLAEAFLEGAARHYHLPQRRLGASARAFINDYPWPGNVRELQSQIERIVLLETEEEVGAEHFLPFAERPPVSIAAEHGALRVVLPSNGLSLEALEREVIREAMRRCEGNVSRAARFLSISRQTLIYRLKKHGIASKADPDADKTP
jgi:DNA-binding NtrC family response regulator